MTETEFIEALIRARRVESASRVPKEKPPKIAAYEGLGTQVAELEASLKELEGAGLTKVARELAMAALKERLERTKKARADLAQQTEVVQYLQVAREVEKCDEALRWLERHPFTLEAAVPEPKKPASKFDGLTVVAKHDELNIYREIVAKLMALGREAEDHSITTNLAMERTGFGYDIVYNHLRYLMKQGTVKRVGAGRSSRYLFPPSKYADPAVADPQQVIDGPAEMRDFLNNVLDG